MGILSLFVYLRALMNACSCMHPGECVNMHACMRQNMSTYIRTKYHKHSHVLTLYTLYTKSPHTDQTPMRARAHTHTYTYTHTHTLSLSLSLTTENGRYIDWLLPTGTFFGALFYSAASTSLILEGFNLRGAQYAVCAVVMAGITVWVLRFRYAR